LPQKLRDLSLPLISVNDVDPGHPEAAVGRALVTQHFHEKETDMATTAQAPATRVPVKVSRWTQ
jgi:hypothetical protein